MIELQHTEVDQAYEGRGLAGRLARGALADARRRSTPVKLTCPFVTSYVERHPEWSDLIVKGSDS